MHQALLLICAALNHMEKNNSTSMCFEILAVHTWILNKDETKGGRERERERERLVSIGENSLASILCPRCPPDSGILSPSYVPFSSSFLSPALRVRAFIYVLKL